MGARVDIPLSGDPYAVAHQTVACLFHFIHNGLQPQERVTRTDEESVDEHEHEKLAGDDFDTVTLLAKEEDTPGVTKSA